MKKSKNEDKDTRYYIDLDLQAGKILGWDYDQRQKLILEKPAQMCHERIYITKGQYHKLLKKQEELNKIA